MIHVAKVKCFIDEDVLVQFFEDGGTRVLCHDVQTCKICPYKVDYKVEFRFGRKVALDNAS